MNINDNKPSLKYSPCFKETTPTTGSNDDDEASVYFFAALVNSTLCLSRS
jgi:hypothetical protein